MDLVVAQDDSSRLVCSNVARLLCEERRRQGLSMTLLAEKAGLSQSMISLVERELRNPTLDTLLRIARVLRVDLADVLRQASRSATSEPSALKAPRLPKTRGGHQSHSR